MNFSHLIARVISPWLKPRVQFYPDYGWITVRYHGTDVGMCAERTPRGWIVRPQTIGDDLYDAEGERGLLPPDEQSVIFAVVRRRIEQLGLECEEMNDETAQLLFDRWKQQFIGRLTATGRKVECLKIEEIEARFGRTKPK